MVHHHHGVSQGDRLRLRVSNMHEGDAEFRLESLQFAAHLQAEKFVQRRKRLVEEKNPGVCNQRAGERNALLLATRELGGHAIAEMVELDALQHLVRTFATLVLPDATHLQIEGDVVENGQVREERVVLEHHRRAALDRRLAHDHLVADIDLTRGRRLVTRDHPQDRRLAAAGWPEKATIGAVRDRQVDVLDGMRDVKPFGHVDQSNFARRLCV